ncbi:MAG: cell division protein SepF [Pseudonocardiaceae bacterium]
MSALYRLKAYFGMVPAEEFDAYHPDYPDYDEPGYHPARERDLSAERPAMSSAYRAGSSGYDEGRAVPSGHSAVPRVQPSRPPSWALDSPSWAAEPSVRGSLAIDPTSMARQSATPLLPSDPLVNDPFSNDGAHPLSRIVTLHPHNYNEARPIGERYREGNPVIINLTEMEDRDAKRLVDFAAGLAFALRGSIDKVTNKVFLLSPPNVDVSAEDRRRIAEGRFLG